MGVLSLATKTYKKLGEGQVTDRTVNNFGIIVVKWVDNNVVKPVSNFVGIEPVTSIERRCKKEKNKKNIPVHKW